MTVKPIEIIKDNYRGVLYESENADTAMIVVTGSDGGIKWASDISEVFRSRGISCLAVAYFKEKRLPKALSLIPIEIMDDARAYLKGKGYGKVGIYGFSKGAELALTAASIFGQFDFVIAVSPACCVFEGIKGRKFSKTSSWSYMGSPLPFVSFDGIKANFARNFVKNGEAGFAREYTEVVDTKRTEKKTIKVEHIKAPILLLSAKSDAMWCSEKMGNLIVQRLQEKNYEYPYRHEVFEVASHILCPVKTKLRLAFKAERKQGKECEESREKALQASLDFINETARKDGNED